MKAAQEPEFYEEAEAELRFRTAVKQALHVPLSEEETAALERIRKDINA